MGSSDSLSFPSEPPDIGNWFSSYAYESQELNTIEDFRDSADSIIAETEEESPNENKENLEENMIVSRNNDFLSPDGKGKSDIKSPPRDDDTYISDELKYSDSFSLGSAPPDVKNWFSSYTYESSVLDTNWEFTSNEKEIDTKCGSPEQEEEMTSNNSTRTRKDDDSENECTPPDHVSAECTKSVEDKVNEKTNLSECKGNKLSNAFHGDSQEKKGKLKSVHPSLDIIKKESSETEDFSMKGIDNLVCGKPVDKENNKEFAETGFISTRKNRRRKRVMNDENSLKKSPPFHVKNGIHSTSESRNEEIVTGRRKVLSERTNFQACNGNEVTGKWKCPQKSKPNPGPPLKQLRLEQWLRRV